VPVAQTLKRGWLAHRVPEGFRAAVEEAVSEYNRLHGVEARARIVELSSDSFKVEFTGSFCLTCGFYDYFDDLAYLVRERGYPVKAVSIEEREGGAIVEYRVTGEMVEEGVRSARPERAILIFEWRREG